MALSGLKFYVRESDGTIREASAQEFSESLTSNKRIIKKTYLGSVEISTVFLGMDMSFDRENQPPLLFETMIFGGLHDNVMLRCCSEKEALEQHEACVQLVKTKGWLSKFMKIIDEAKSKTIKWYQSENRDKGKGGEEMRAK